MVEVLEGAKEEGGEKEEETYEEGEIEKIEEENK